MSAYFFRFLGDNGPTGWVGFALARNMDEMFWQIDEHGDPYSAEIKTTDRFSWCAMLKNDNYEQHEICETCPIFVEEHEWRKPSWVREREEARKAKPEPEKFGYDPSAPF